MWVAAATLRDVGWRMWDVGGRMWDVKAMGDVRPRRAGRGRRACRSPPRLPSQTWDVGALGPGCDPGRRGGLRGDGVAGWALGGEYGVWTACQGDLRDLFGFVEGGGTKHGGSEARRRFALKPGCDLSV